MVILNNISGKLNQTTIHGELEFVIGNDYKITKTNIKNVVLATGEYQIHDTDETIEASIEITENELSNY